MTDAGDNVVPIEDGPRYREPPQNVEVEAALLGTILSNNRVFEQVAAMQLSPEHFHEPLHALIYSAAGDLIDSGKRADPITLRHHFADNDERAYLGEIAASVIDATAAPQYAETIIFLHRARAAIGVAEILQEALYKDGDDSNHAIEAGIEGLSRLVETDSHKSGMRPLSAVHKDTLAEIERDRKGETPAGIMTGLSALDRILNLMPGDMTVLGARPSMGKTGLALCLAEHCARNHGPVAFFSLEMRDLQLARRQLAGQTDIATQRLTGRRARDLSQGDFTALVDAAQRCKGLPLMIDDTAYLTVATIYARAKRLQRRMGLSLIIVDYLQLLQASREARAKRNDTSEVSEHSLGLKNIAKRLGVHLIALSQLSREVEKRANKRPMLSDLRQSGSIEQDADNVAFLYREEYYLEREMAQNDRHTDDESLAKYMKASGRRDGVKGIAEIIVPKQRQGPTGSCEVHFDADTQRFTTLQKEDQDDLL